MRDHNIVAAVSLVMTKDGEIGISKSEGVTLEIMGRFMKTVIDECYKLMDKDRQSEKNGE